LPVAIFQIRTVLPELAEADLRPSGPTPHEPSKLDVFARLNAPLSFNNLLGQFSSASIKIVDVQVAGADAIIVDENTGLPFPSPADWVMLSF
jgi:hypothetical protein